MKRIALTLILSAALLGLGTVTRAQDSPPAAPDKLRSQRERSRTGRSDRGPTIEREKRP